MYSLNKKQIVKNNLCKNFESIKSVNGVLMNSKGKSISINGSSVKSIKVVSVELSKSMYQRQVGKKYNKLIKLITDLLMSDDDTGEAYREALNQIEKFRLEIKNKFRIYLEKEQIEFMVKQLSILEKQAKMQYMELQNFYTNEVSKGGKGR